MQLQLSHRWRRWRSRREEHCDRRRHRGASAAAETRTRRENRRRRRPNEDSTTRRHWRLLVHEMATGRVAGRTATAAAVRAETGMWLRVVACGGRDD